VRRVDKRRGVYRKPRQTARAANATPETYTNARWSRTVAAGDIVPAVVMALPKAAGGPARIRIGSSEVDLPRARSPGPGRSTRPTSSPSVDVIEVAVGTIDKGQYTQLTLEQVPVVEGALIAIDNRTGQIRAMVGGFDFARSKFNRATQARRQVGSLFKPVLYSAAIDRGFTAETIFIDEPVSFVAGPNQPPYRPLNYDRKYEGR
jgi:penicillin-binding protein 1A